MRKEKFRTFISVEFPDEIIKEVARVQGVLEKKRFNGKLTELGKLHLTLKFLGEIDSERVKEVKKRLSGIEFEEMELRLGRVGTFSHRGNPRIVWVEVLGKGIFELQKKIDSVLADLFRREDRFMGHLTIARVKFVNSPEDFVNYVDKISAKKLKFKVDGFKLKSSELKEAGPRHKTLETYAANG